MRVVENRFDYNAKSRELEIVMSKLQSNSLEVDDAIEMYQHGMKLAKELESYLKKADNKVTKIIATWQDVQVKE